MMGVVGGCLPTRGNIDKLSITYGRTSTMLRIAALGFLAFASVSASAQQISASLDQLAATPLVTVQISEQLRTPPDQATITAGTESHAATASAALTANKLATEQLLNAIRASA